jgi:hypothetical protein
MKTIFSLLLILLGFDRPKEIGFETCSQDDQYNCAANMLSMNHRLCMDFSEVSGQMYKTYLLELKSEYGADSEEFLSNQPNWQHWEEAYPGLKAEEISQLFFESTTFALAPIIGVTYEQARTFAEWRTEAFKKELSKMDKRERAYFPIDFEFRLPTPAEWSRMRFMTQEKGMLKAVSSKASDYNKEFKLSKNDLLNEKAKINSVFSTMDEKLGMSHIHDNVSEMTSEVGKAMGGNWKKAENKVDFNKQIEYTGAQSWLGFRCIFEIIE